MIRYIIGSSDSLDIDTCYIVSELPGRRECKAFCDNLLNENANLAVVENGIIVSCYKGTPDELNNAIYYTYSLHHQDYPLLIKRPVPRNILIKDMRATRGILSYLSRTIYREKIKHALRGGFGGRLELLDNIDLSLIDFTVLDKKFNGVHALKVLAFQIGQARGLHDDVELYTKSDIAATYPNLKPYLYRQTVFPALLHKELKQYLDILHTAYPQIIDFGNRTSLINGVLFNMKTETIID